MTYTICHMLPLVATPLAKVHIFDISPSMIEEDGTFTLVAHQCSKYYIRVY